VPVSAVLLALAGRPRADRRPPACPLREAIAAFADGAWGSPYSIGASLNRAVALALVGLGFIVAHRANLTNVGGEGQIAVGGIVSTTLCLYGGAASLPGPLAWIVPLLAAALAGGLWGSIAGFLKVRIGTNEVISTLLLSFIAVWALYGCVQSTHLLRQPMTNSATLPESLEIPGSHQGAAADPDLDMPLHLGAIVCLVAAASVALVLARSLFGLRLRARRPQSAGRAARRHADRRHGRARDVHRRRVRRARRRLHAAGRAARAEGALPVRATGLDGLVVGLLARGTAKGVLASALLFGFLRSGGIAMELVAGVPSAIVLVIQGSSSCCSPAARGGSSAGAPI
jgi:simple sugar transport system permease protein